jgi:hypothetical protein
MLMVIKYDLKLKKNFFYFVKQNLNNEIFKYVEAREREREQK